MERYYAGELRSDQKESWKADDGIFVLYTDHLATLDKLDEVKSLAFHACGIKDNQIAALQTETRRLYAETVKYREALEQYADETNYGSHTDRDTNVMGREYESTYITIDIGPELAQSALKQTEGGTP